MEGGYARGVRRQAARQARAMVELLGAHPSIVVWCAHDAPLGDDAPAARDRQRHGSHVGEGSARPLDRAGDRARRRHAARRPQLRCGRRLASLVRMAARDARRTRPGAPRGAPARSLRLRVRRAVGAVDGRLDAARVVAGPRLGGARRAPRDGAAARSPPTYPPADAKSFDEWADATQAYQAALLQLQIEDLRRCKGTPCGGFAVFCLADPSPAVGFGLLDHERVEKRAYASGARRVPPGARHGRSAFGPRPRGQRHPRADGRRGRRRGGRRSDPAVARRHRSPTRWSSSARPISTTRSTSRSC